MMGRTTARRGRETLLLVAGLGAALVFSALSCQGVLTGLGWTAAFANNLLSTASGNYSPEYAEKMDELLAALSEEGEGRQAGQVGETGEERTRLDVALLKQTRDAAGAVVLEPIADGDVLVDGRGDPGAGERFRIAFEASRTCFVYIIGVDATGWVSLLFPSKYTKASNPVEMGRSYEIPDQEWAFSLDQHRGLEHVFCVASRERSARIETLCKSFEALARPTPSASLEVTQPAVVERGLDEILENSTMLIQAVKGGPAELTAMSFMSKVAARDLVITRWFRHE